jgi:hypothetical protein
VRLTQQIDPSGIEFPSITVLSLFYHQCLNTVKKQLPGQILHNDGYDIQPLDYNLVVGNCFENVLLKLDSYTTPLPSASPLLTPEEIRILKSRIRSSHGILGHFILPSDSLPFHHWQPPLVASHTLVPHHSSNIYHRNSGYLLAPFHPDEFEFNDDNYLKFIGRYGVYLVASLGILQDFATFLFDFDSYQQNSYQSSTTTDCNLSHYSITNPSCHLYFRGFSILLGGDELISYSPWKTYGEGFHVDVAPRNILRNIPSLSALTFPFTTLIPLGHHDLEYKPADYPYREVNINHPLNVTKVLFGNVLHIKGDTLYQGTMHMDQNLGLHPAIFGRIDSVLADQHLLELKSPTVCNHPIELTPLKTLNLNILQVKDFILDQKRHSLDFLKCAIVHMSKLRIFPEESTNLQLASELRECYDYLHFSHDYIFPSELSLALEHFSGLTTQPQLSPFPQSVRSSYSNFSKKSDNLENVTIKSDSPQTDPILVRGRVRFPPTGKLTYIRGVDPEEFTDPVFLHSFGRTKISWSLYDVAGNGNCGFYVHQCHLELHNICTAVHFDDSRSLISPKLPTTYIFFCYLIYIYPIFFSKCCSLNRNTLLHSVFWLDASTVQKCSLSRLTNADLLGNKSIQKTGSCKSLILTTSITG